MVAIHHPHLAGPVAHQGNRLAAQVGAAFAGILGAEVPQPAAHFGQPHAELGWTELGNGNFQQFAGRARGKLVVLGPA